MSSNYGSFTAEQWKVWTLEYSMYVLKDLLPEPNYVCWQAFVQGCRKICSPIITHDEINAAHLLFVKFCSTFENIYGSDAVRPNIHLRDSIENFGPVYSFWLFSFERYNGILGKIKTNNRLIEVQMMREFLSGIHLDQMMETIPKMHDLSPVITLLKDLQQEKLGFDEDLHEELMTIHNVANASLERREAQPWSSCMAIQFPLKYTVSAIDKTNKSFLCQAYRFMYPSYFINQENLNDVIFKFSSLHIGEEFYGSTSAFKSQRHSQTVAVWHENDGEIGPEATQQVGFVKYYNTHTLRVEGTQKSTPLHTLNGLKARKANTMNNRLVRLRFTKFELSIVGCALTD